MPNREAILKAIFKCEELTTKAFVKKYKSRLDNHYIQFNEKLYPVKSIWAASHNPPILVKSFNTKTVITELKKLKFVTVNKKKPKEYYEEGEMLSREISFFKRNPKLVEEAKKLRGCDCEACGFNFKEKYGFNGEGYIEAHHNTPLSAGEGEPVLNSIADISLLCANCHRMAHRNKKCLTISELKAIIEPPQ